MNPSVAQPVAVALSAGADSTALLLSAQRLWPGRVLALHVNHGMQAAASGFEERAAQLAHHLGVPFWVERVSVQLEPGQSPEDMARRVRYQALARMAQQAGACTVLLGHQADDQAETLALALGRGAGLPGLAAMAPVFERHGMRFGRPLLSMGGGELRQWLKAEAVLYVEDPSNVDLRLARNRIRHVLMPAWERCFPAYRDTLARTARHLAQAQGLLDELARIDLQQTGSPPSIAGLQALGRERQANVLRHWIKGESGQGPTTAQLETLLDLLDRCRTRGHRIHLKVAGGWVDRVGGVLRWTPPV